jgi:hypothetical protein
MEKRIWENRKGRENAEERIDLNTFLVGFIPPYSFVGWFATMMYFINDISVYILQ